MNISMPIREGHIHTTGKREEGQKYINRPKSRGAHVYQYAKKERGIRDPANYRLEAHVHQQAKLGGGET
jgi:hypothetical protein